MIRLAPNWKQILVRAWTVWLAVISALASYVQTVHADVVALLPVLKPYLSEGQAGLVALAAAAMVPLARIIKQASLHADEVIR